jgi:hypothetical protein
VNRFSLRSQKKSPKANLKNASFAGFLRFSQITKSFSENATCPKRARLTSFA